MSTDVAPLIDAVRGLWTEPVDVRLGTGHARPVPHACEFIVVPNARRPAMLLPAGSRRAAATAAARWGSEGSGTGRLKQWGLVAALRLGLAGAVLPDRVIATQPNGAEGGSGDGPMAGPNLAGHLSEHFGRDVLLAVRVGTLRPNRKPVLQVLGPDGSLIAFVKVGHDPLTRDLVRAEAQALSRVHAARLSTVIAPVPLLTGDWHGLELLVLSPLSPRRTRLWRGMSRLPAEAVREVAGIGTDTVPSRSPLRAAPFWLALQQRAAGLLDAGERTAARAVITQLGLRHGETQLALGGWHGDWTPWNMRPDHGGRVRPDQAGRGRRGDQQGYLQLWDWERFATGVPVGFDALHYRLNHHRVIRGLPTAQAVDRLLADAGSTLHGLGPDGEQAALVAELYLLELAIRYLQDGQTPSGSLVRRHGNAVLSALGALLAEGRPA